MMQRLWNLKRGGGGHKQERLPDNEPFPDGVAPVSPAISAACDQPLQPSAVVESPHPRPGHAWGQPVTAAHAAVVPVAPAQAAPPLANGVLESVTERQNSRKHRAGMEWSGSELKARHADFVAGGGMDSVDFAATAGETESSQADFAQSPAFPNAEAQWQDKEWGYSVEDLSRMLRSKSRNRRHKAATDVNASPSAPCAVNGYMVGPYVNAFVPHRAAPPKRGPQQVANSTAAADLQWAFSALGPGPVFPHEGSDLLDLDWAFQPNSVASIQSRQASSLSRSLSSRPGMPCNLEEPDVEWAVPVRRAARRRAVVDEVVDLSWAEPAAATRRPVSSRPRAIEVSDDMLDWATPHMDKREDKVGGLQNNLIQHLVEEIRQLKDQVATASASQFPTSASTTCSWVQPELAGASWAQPAPSGDSWSPCGGGQDESPANESFRNAWPPELPKQGQAADSWDTSPQQQQLAPAAGGFDPGWGWETMDDGGPRRGESTQRLLSDPDRDSGKASPCASIPREQAELSFGQNASQSTPGFPLDSMPHKAPAAPVEPLKDFQSSSQGQGSAENAPHAADLREEQAHWKVLQEQQAVEKGHRAAKLGEGARWEKQPSSTKGSKSVEAAHCASELREEGLTEEAKAHRAAELGEEGWPVLKPQQPIVPSKPQQVTWAIEPNRLAEYEAAFQEADSNRDGFAEGAEVRHILDKTALPSEVLSHIWQLSDVDQDGRLCLSEFVCAIHMATNCRRHGVLPPDELPEELSLYVSMPNTARAYGKSFDGLPLHPPPPPAAAPPPEPEEWALEEEELQQYCAAFTGLDPHGTGYISPEAGREVFEWSQLPIVELSHIWTISDADGDGRLAPNEFVCAMAIARRRRLGMCLPYSAPPTFLRDPGWQALRSATSLTEAAVRPQPSAQKPPTAPPPVQKQASHQPEAQLQWAVGQQELDRYRAMFATLRDAHFGTVGPDEGRQHLEKSKLPTHELVHIWRLCDVDGDGRLALGEFLCAMALATRRVQGAPIPQTLPVEMAKLVDRALESAKTQRRAEAPVKEEVSTSLQTASTASARRGVSDWEVMPSELESYQEYFRRLDKAGAGIVEIDVARQVLENSNLPIEELARIWDLSDTGVSDMVGLALGEFICAMALVARRKRGLPLPAELPPELAQHAGGDHMAARA